MKPKFQTTAVIACGLAWWTAASAQVQQVWITRYSTSFTGNGIVRAIAVDGMSNVVVTGDLGTVKYDGNGNQAWAVSNGSDPQAITLGNAGAVFVSGVVGIESVGGQITEYRARTEKLDANGHLLWAITNGRGGSVALANDGVGNIYIATSPGGIDMAINEVSKYDDAGNLLCTVTNRPFAGFTECYPPRPFTLGSVGMDMAGNVYELHTGRRPGGGLAGLSCEVIKYASDGRQLWIGRDDRLGLCTGSLAFDNSGAVFVSGAGGWAAFDSGGNELGVAETGGYTSVVDGIGDIYVTGRGGTAKYDNNGNQLWAVLSDEPDFFGWAIILDSAGNLYVGGSSAAFTTNAAYVIMKYQQTPVAGFPRLSEALRDQKVLAGTNVTFTVVANGAVPLSYQWRFGADPIAGATNATLSLTNVDSSRAGLYSVLVSNVVGSIVSREARLALIPPPAILSGAVLQPAGRFQFTITGEAGIWYRIELSEDLANWFSAGEFFNENGSIHYIDFGACSVCGPRFYRAVGLP